MFTYIVVLKMDLKKLTQRDGIYIPWDRQTHPKSPLDPRAYDGHSVLRETCTKNRKENI
jgi:hypothetical protein